MGGSGVSFFLENMQRNHYSLGERCTGWLTFFIFALKVLLFDVLSRTWSYKIE